MEDDPAALIFADTKGGALRLSNWRRTSWRQALSRSGLQRLTIHDLRGTAITNWLDAGVPPTTVQIWAGHASVDVTTRNYTNPTDVQIAASVAISEEVYGRASGGADVVRLVR